MRGCRNHTTPIVDITSDMEREMLALWDDQFDTDEIAKALGCGVKEWQVDRSLRRLRENRRLSLIATSVA